MRIDLWYFWRGNNQSMETQVDVSGRNWWKWKKFPKMEIPTVDGSEIRRSPVES